MFASSVSTESTNPYLMSGLLVWPFHLNGNSYHYSLDKYLCLTTTMTWESHIIIIWIVGSVINIVTYNSKDLYILLLFISHGCLIWSSWDHESNTESGQFRGSVFFLIIFTNAIFYSNCTIVLICQLTCWLTWSTCWLMLTNIDQDLVNILTDSEQTYQPMGAISTQLRYKKFMIKCIVCL